MAPGLIEQPNARPKPSAEPDPLMLELLPRSGAITPAASSQVGQLSWRRVTPGARGLLIGMICGASLFLILAVIVDLQGSSAQSAGEKRHARLVATHVAGMGLALLLFLPLALVVLTMPKGTFRSIRRRGTVHGLIATCGACFAIIGAAAIFMHKEYAGKPHLVTTHGGLGFLSSMVLLFNLALGACLRLLPGACRRGIERWFSIYKWHRRIGWVGLAVATIATLTGFESNWAQRNVLLGEHSNSPLALRIAQLALRLAVILIALGLYVLLRIPKPDDSEAGQGVSPSTASPSLSDTGTATTATAANSSSRNRLQLTPRIPATAAAQRLHS